jgi:hypothetical protein
MRQQWRYLVMATLGIVTPTVSAGQKRIVNDQTPNPISFGAKVILKPQSSQCPQSSSSQPLGLTKGPAPVTTLRSLNEQLAVGVPSGPALSANCLASPVRLSPQFELQGSINLKQAHRLFRRASPPDTLKCRTLPAVGQAKC